MKRSVFIIIGVVLVLILIAVWVYMLFFSTAPSGDEQFGNIDFEDTNDSTDPGPGTEPETEPVVDMQTNQRLRQLTTRPVAGFKEVSTGTSTPNTVLYMEIGTGHIYSIDLGTGAEERISATTIPEAQKAEFSQDGLYVMVQSGFEMQKEFILGEVHSTSSSLSTTKLGEPITSFRSTVDNSFVYSVQTNTDTIGKVLDPTDLTTERLFTLPLRETTIEWGGSVSDAHYAYPKATRHLQNFLYQIKNGTITRMPVDGYGMSALGNDNSIMYAKQENETYQSYSLNIQAGTESELPFIQIPEKCVMGESESPLTICANSTYDFAGLLPDSWYKGEILSSDSLWEMSPDGRQATFLVNPEQTSGRSLDITRLQIADDMANIYFTNQLDQTLWVYERIPTDANQN